VGEVDAGKPPGLFEGLRKELRTRSQGEREPRAGSDAWDNFVPVLSATQPVTLKSPLPDAGIDGAVCSSLASVRRGAPSVVDG
jgi:hypothetical protein